MTLPVFDWSQIPAHVQVVAVSKLQDQTKIRTLFDEKHHLDYGENYVQEALQKIAILSDLPLRWHFIGSLQTNKIKQILGKFHLIHSVDSFRLAEKISAASLAQPQGILLQLNLAGEASKGGFSQDEFAEAWVKLKALPGIKINGFMTMPPLFENAETTRPYFKQLREICDQAKKELPEACHLSMGTSQDFRVAIEEGATLVRLGSLIFGDREPRRISI